MIAPNSNEQPNAQIEMQILNMIISMILFGTN